MFSNTCSALGNNIDSIDISLITGAALVDSINPCAIAVLLLLLGGLLALGDRKKALLAGASFIMALYLTYFTIGLGLWGTIQFTGLGGWLHRIVGLIAIIVGLANIKDYFWHGGLGFVTEIPRRWRPWMKKILRNVTSPLGAFTAGIIVTLCELPCTGGPYIFVLGLLSNGYTLPPVIATLIYYNLIFVLPLIVIVLLMHFGYTNVARASKWQNRNLRLLHLVAGLIMLALGIWIFLN